MLVRPFDVLAYFLSDCPTVKAHLRRHNQSIRSALDPVLALTEACACITPEKARAWFIHAGYTS